MLVAAMTCRPGFPLSRFHLLVWSGALCLALTGVLAQSPSRMTVREDRTNLRARPTTDAEVLASLRRGEVLEVLGEVKGEADPSNGNRSWTKVRLPPQVAVWVYAPLIETGTGRVRGEVANFRAGPGSNYSALGQLKQGETVVAVRREEDWMQIEPPVHAVAFVATGLLTPEVNPDPPAEAATAAPPVTSDASEKPLVEASDVPATPVKTTEASPATRKTVATEQPSTPPALAGIPSAGPTVATTPPSSGTSREVNVPPTYWDYEQVPPPQPPPTTPTDGVYQAPLQPRTQRGVLVKRRAPVPLTEPEVGRSPRRVTREGTVKPSRNIQAPGHHQLENKEGLVNYLVPGDPDLELERFRGVRVRITGTEWRDSRWITPLLKVESIRPQ